MRVGFADLHGVAGAALPYGITALVALPREIVGPLVDQPHRAYYDTYQAINVRLDAMAEGCAALLRAYGYQATANTEEHLPTGAEDRSPLPHKAVACRAGLGWIGKNNLLTTPDFGGAVRLCTVVTDAPLPTAEPILSSRCGSCRVCVDACPSSALYGTLWHTGLDRDDLFDTCCVSAPQGSEPRPFLRHPHCHLRQVLRRVSLYPAIPEKRIKKPPGQYNCPAVFG